LARGAANDCIQLPGPLGYWVKPLEAPLGCRDDVCPRKVGSISTYHFAFWKVENVSGCMNRVVFDRRNDIEPRLLEAESHTSSTGKQIDRYRTGWAITDTSYRHCTTIAHLLTDRTHLARVSSADVSCFWCIMREW